LGAPHHRDEFRRRARAHVAFDPFDVGPLARFPGLFDRSAHDPADPARAVRSIFCRTDDLQRARTDMVEIAANERLLVIDFGMIVFIGDVEAIPDHKCAGTVVAFGLDRDIAVTTPWGERCGRCLVAPPGTVRRVVAGGRIAVCVIDPDVELDPTFDVDDAARALSEMSSENVEAAWGSLLKALRRTARSESLDPRVKAAVAALNASTSVPVAAARIADELALSLSRLEHLFAREIGTPMRSFRNWCRLRRAAEVLADGSDLTQAALAAGFYDQSHFNRTFRQSFGISPSFVFVGGTRIHVVRRNVPA